MWQFLLFIFLWLSFNTSLVTAWEVTLRTTEGKTHLAVNSEREMKGMDVYLVWFNRDAEAGKEAVKSWTFTQGWQSSKIVPVANTALDIPRFETFNLTEWQNDCAAEHRCFLAMVAVKAGVNPLLESNWEAVSMLPLSAKAASERMKGQTIFLPANINNRNTTDFAGIASGNPIAPPAATTTATEKNNTSDTATATTEKPDLFRYIGNEVLYANGAAQRFQIINVADPQKPVLTASAKLKGYPLELYVLNNFYILLQNNYQNFNTATVLTVFRKAEGNSLELVQELPLTGQFLQSRRRNEVLYTVTQQFTVENQLIISALRLDNSGQLRKVDEATLSGYNLKGVAIFPNHLVIANSAPNQWIESQVQVYHLANPTDVLQPLPLLRVAGQIPSEFHLDVYDRYLRIMYGSQFQNDKLNNTLAIYDLQNSTLPLVGKVEGIARGEQLFATRFAGEKAYIVTYKRTDPLFVIDLANPAQPRVVGELKIPGWSEKLFFKENLLFGVGIHDQPEPNEETRWVRRLALSLFDVANPTNPTLLSRFIPLAGQVTSSHSEALNDERALLLNWEKGYAALPFDAWGYVNTTGNNGGYYHNYLQIVDFSNRKIEDAGRLDSPISLRRSVTLADKLLAALSDDALYTLQWGNGQVQKLGEVELAANITQLFVKNARLYAAVQGQQGINSFREYDLQQADKVQRRWGLSNAFQQVVSDDKTVVFINYYPLQIQVLDLQTGQLTPPKTLDSKDATDTSGATTTTARTSLPYYGYGGNAIVQNGWIYIIQNQYYGYDNLPEPRLSVERPFKMPNDINMPLSILRGWNLNDPTVTTTHTIPGALLGFNAAGELITQESIYQLNSAGKMQSVVQVNRLALSTDKVRLLDTKSLICKENESINLLWVDKNLFYQVCSTFNYYYPAVMNESSISRPIGIPPVTEGQLDIIALNTQDNFAIQGEWTLKNAQINTIAKNLALVMETTRTEGGTACNLYRLVPAAQPKLIKTLDTCYAALQTVLTEQQAWFAKGYEGIETVEY